MRGALFWGRRFPPDGRGLFAPGASEFGEAIRAAGDSFWKGRVPGWAQLAAAAASGCAWGILAPLLARHYAKARRLSPAESWRLAWDCLRTGGQPNEVWIWSQCFPARGLHPLPARAGSALFSWLGDSACKTLLSDKVAAARMLEGAGLRTPKVVRVIVRGSAPPTGNELFFGAEYSALFAKPRHGSAGRGTLSIEVFGDGQFSVNGGEAVRAETLAACLAAGAAGDDLVVQEMLTGCPELADLSTERAPVLRVTTAREPGEAPFLHSALLAIPVPGENAVDFLNGHVWAPVDPNSGALGYGIRFAEPENRLEVLPWSSAPLRGRAPPGFARCIEATLEAMKLVPGLPLVAWDTILASGGPGILEGNTSGSWILTELPSLQGMEVAPLEPLLIRWARARGG